MYEVEVRDEFSAAHFIKLYDGSWEPRHGHNWEVTATVEAEREGDAAAFCEGLDAWVAGVDYTLLNDQPSLAERNPTAELLAQWAFEHLRGAGLRPVAVKVREKANYWALCREGLP